jgi:hypothetical protein
VAKRRPVLAAAVRLIPNVKAVWPTAIPRQPNPAIGSRSPRRRRLFGSSRRSTPYIRRPPTTNRKATTQRGGKDAAANLVAA